MASVQAAASQVVGDDYVGDRVEHHLDVPCVRGTGHVTVDLLIGRAVLALELCLDVSSCVIVSVRACRENSQQSGREETVEESQDKKTKREDNGERKEQK